MAIRTEFDSFGTLMETSVIRQVPMYQRRYTWGRQQIELLWDDLLRLYKAREIGEPVKHFIGPLILGEPKSRGLQPSTTQIIDGQQRLITLSLMVMVIRDLLVNEEDFDVLTEKYLVLRHGNRTPELRLQPGRWDLDVYEEAVLSEAEFSDEESPVARAYWWIADLIHKGPGIEDEALTEDGSQVDEGSSWEDLESNTPSLENDDAMATWDAATLLACITEDLELAIVSDVPEERSYEIFATINATGLRLSQVDLIRNMIFVNVPNLANQLFETAWQPMEDTLDVSGLDAYLHCWVMAHGKNISRRNTYGAMVSMLKERGNAEEAIVDMLTEISSDCGSFILAAYPDRSSAIKKFKVRDVPTSLRDALTRLAEWGSVPLQPVLFLVVKKWREGSITADQAELAVASIESLVVRRYICAIPPNDLRSSFARLAAHVSSFSGSAFITQVMKELKDPSRRWPSDKEVRAACLDVPLYRNKVNFCFFILKRLATSLEGPEAPSMKLGVSSTSWSVEHLMPRSMPTAWTSDLRRWNYRNPNAVFQEFGDTLGNLTITVFNPDLGNLSFNEKVEKLRNRRHKLELTRDFLEAHEWGQREIVKRSKALADLVVKTWPNS